MDERISKDIEACFPSVSGLETLCRYCHSQETNSPDKTGFKERAEWRKFAGGTS